MTNWKTYTSSDLLKEVNISFKVKYPDNWFVNEENPNHTSNVPSVVISEEPVKNVMSRDSTCFSIKEGIYSSSMTINEFILYQGIAPPSMSLKEDVTINGMTGVKRKIIQHGETQESWQVFLRGGTNPTYDKDNINLFLLESCPGTSDTVFNQILSTFKFIP